MIKGFVPLMKNFLVLNVKAFLNKEITLMDLLKTGTYLF